MTESPGGPVDIASVLTVLGGAPAGEVRRALEPTWADPATFTHALDDYLRDHTEGLQSRRGRYYDLYGDLIGRHQAAGGVALIHPGRGSGGWLKVSYGELHEMSARLATVWVRAGAAPGARVALILPPGPALVLGVLTALRLGMVAAFVPPAGRGFVRRRLELAPPSFVVRRAEDAAWIDAKGIAPLDALPASGVVSELAGRSHGFGPDDPAMEVWSPLSPEPPTPVPVRASDLFDRLAIDATLVLALRRGERVTAPGLVSRLHQPVLPLTALFAGSTWVESDVPRLAANPLALDVVGVAPELRDLVLGGTLRLEGCRRWFMSPAEPYDWAAWRAFGTSIAAGGGRGQNLFVSAGFGGALLFSPPSVHPGLDLFPTPGWAWMLEEPGTPGQGTEAAVGILAARDELLPVGAVGSVLIADAGETFTFGGTGLAGRRGTRYPRQEISRVAESHPAVDGASVVLQPNPHTLNQLAVSLVVFVYPGRDPRPVQAKLTEELLRLIEQEMGTEPLPDRVLVFPLTPRRLEDRSVDPEWCRFQLLTGALEARSKNEIYRWTSLLRRWAAERIEEANPWPS